MTTFVDSLESKNTQALFSELLGVQADAYGYLDNIFLSEFISRSEINEVIDIGTGEASFLFKLASSNKQTKFTGIESNQQLFSTANKRAVDIKNVCILNATVGVDKIDKSGDLVFTRLVVQHEKSPIDLLNNMLALVRSGGHVYMIEPVYDYYDCDPLPVVWREYRERLMCSYKRLGSASNIPKQLPSWLSELGCKKIRSSIHLYSCSTIGKSRFCAVVRATAATLNSMHPDLWGGSYLEELDAWLDLIGVPGSSDPFISIAHTVATKT